MGVVQGVINIGRPVVKGREQESQRRGGNHLVHRAVVEQLFLRDVVKIRLGLLDGADGAENEGVGLVGIVRLRIAVLALEGNVVAVAAQQNQVIALDGNGVDDLLAEFPAKRVVRQLGLPQIHEHFMLRGACHLTCLEGDVNEILADGAGKRAAQKGKIFVGLVLRHDAGTLAELGDDLLIVVHIAAVNGRDIAAIPPQMPPDLADFLIVHGFPSLVC